MCPWHLQDRHIRVHGARIEVAGRWRGVGEAGTRPWQEVSIYVKEEASFFL